MSFALCLLQNNAVPFPCLPWGGCRTPHQLLNILCEVQLGSTSPKSHFSCLLLDLKCIFFCWSAGRLFFFSPQFFYGLCFSEVLLKVAALPEAWFYKSFFLLPFSVNYKFLAVLAPLSLWWSLSSQVLKSLMLLDCTKEYFLSRSSAFWNCKS